MKGLVLLGDREIAIRDFEDPKAGKGQVVVKMIAVAVCGTDLRPYRAPKSGEAVESMIIPGHEPSGIVAETGPGVSRVKVGDRVAVYHFLGCGHCMQCLKGDFMHCKEVKGYGGPIHGSDAEYLLTNEINCLPLPDDFTFEDGALIACAAGTAFSALMKLNPNGKDTLLVLGLGPVGLCSTIIGKALGARVIGVEPIAYRRELALKVGADAVLDVGPELVKAVEDYTNGNGADIVIETSGKPASQSISVFCCRPLGKLGIVGYNPEPTSISTGEILGRQLELRGSHVMPIHYYWPLVDLMKRHAIHFDSIITHRFPLMEAREAFRIFETGNTGKIIFTFK